MNDFARSIGVAISLIANGDAELLGIVALSLRVSLTASIVALLIGAPIGAWLAIARFRGQQVIIVFTNALLGLPPVVVGLALYLLLSRSGPLARVGWVAIHANRHGDCADAACHADRGGAGASAVHPAVG
jgi:tungstate transport system permease protein